MRHPALAAIDDLITQITDESLCERNRAEIKHANKQKKFSLVYEEDLSESTPLYDVPVKKGFIVAKKNRKIMDSPGELIVIKLSLSDGCFILQNALQKTPAETYCS